MKTTFAPARTLSRISGILGILLVMAGDTVGAEPNRPNRDPAEEIVAEALQREIYGLARERQHLLNAAARQTPQYPPAHWHRGMVKDARNAWVSIEGFIQSWTNSRRIKRYEEARRQAGDTLEGQLALAEFCRREEMPDQMRAALTRVVETVPDHDGARRALGYARRGPLWLSREQLASEEALVRASEESRHKWGKRLAEIAGDLASDSRRQREAARDRILTLADPSAIPALEQMISPLSDKAAEAVIASLSQCAHPEASLSLARHAVYYPSLAVREKAADALARRDWYSFVPALLDLMVTPVQSRVTAGLLPSGRIGYRHSFVRQTQVREELLILDTEYVRIALEGGARSESRQIARADLRNTVLAREAEAVRRNELTVRLNERVAWVLNRVTGKDLPASAETWWKWWEEENQSDQTGPKPKVVNRQFHREYVMDQVPQIGGKQSGGTEEPSGGSQGGGSGGSFAPPTTIHLFGPQLLNSHCLVAGTIIWTASGPRSIERIERGDLVLSQDVESGALAFKPVLRTIQTKRGPTLRLTVGRETVACSDGHVFWVSGEGWKKASELASGMLMHTPTGSVPLVSVEGGEEVETYNLVVADFATYFVGRQKILAHDFTIRRATSAIVPGLSAP